MTLDNGQTWTQYVTEGRPGIKVGDVVTIRPSVFGAYLLVGPDEWKSKVHQVEEATPSRRARPSNCIPTFGAYGCFNQSN